MIRSSPTRARASAIVAAIGLAWSGGCWVDPSPTACRPGGPSPASAPGLAPLADDGEPVAPPAPGPPPRPLAPPIPPEPSSADGGGDLARRGGDELAATAGRLAAEGRWAEAARFQYWASKAGAAGEYDLARWTGLAGDVEAAFYRLQEAALGDGVDASWADQDPGLAALRKDPRWKGQVEPFLRRCNASWAASGHRQTVLVVPAGYRPGTPIAVVVGLHGRGDRPDRFLDPATFQPLADELGMAFVGVSGTLAIGRRSFLWSEDPAADAEHIRRALGDLSGRLTPRPGRRIALGFSQGGQVGFADPGEYRGAIVMSPGATRRFHRLAGLSPSAANHGQGFVCLCGAGEAAGNLGFTRSDADFARRAGARVELRLAEGQAAHAPPADLAASLARWLRFVDAEAPKPE